MATYTWYGGTSTNAGVAANYKLAGVVATSLPQAGDTVTQNGSETRQPLTGSH